MVSPIHVAAAAVSGTFFNMMMTCAATYGIHKPLRVRVRRAVALDRSGVMRDAMLLPNREFKRFYRMDKPTFLFVLGQVGPHLELGDNHRGDGIAPEVALLCVLTWLRGGSHLDACRIHNISMCARAFERGVRERARRVATPAQSPIPRAARVLFGMDHVGALLSHAPARTCRRRARAAS